MSARGSDPGQQAGGSLRLITTAFSYRPGSRSAGQAPSSNFSRGPISSCEKPTGHHSISTRANRGLHVKKRHSLRSVRSTYSYNWIPSWRGHGHGLVGPGMPIPSENCSVCSINSCTSLGAADVLCRRKELLCRSRLSIGSKVEQGFGIAASVDISSAICCKFNVLFGSFLSGPGVWFFPEPISLATSRRHGA